MEILPTHGLNIMPTGYTYKFQDKENYSVKEYLRDCATAFGALVEYRDTNIDTSKPLTELESTRPRSNYHQEQIESSKKRLLEFYLMSEEDKRKQYNEYVKEQNEYYETRKKEVAELKERYLSAKEKVLKFNPPTPEHVRFKQFALEQLDQSMDWDCKEPEPPFIDSYYKWKNDFIESCEYDISYHTEELEKDLNRKENRNQWIVELEKELEKYED